ncbi:HAD-IIA family hydrolase [Kytococcus sedentarius]|uniref:HAD-IIA family hydrolase n=1 Tax=Kytococcus sedentarius TaxID=1276 RepID=UPI0035BBC261
MTDGSGTVLHGIRGVVCDVDGVVHAGDRVFTEAVDALNAWMSSGVGVVFVTNNASRSPEELAARLVDDGVRVRVEQVLTGAMAGAHVVAQQVPSGSAVFVAGSQALAHAISDAGMVLTDDPTEAAAVVQGYAPSMTYQRLHDAARAVTAGAEWVATNRDLTLPTAWGQAPGNGAYVAAVAHATGQEPVVACKPEAAVYEMALERLGCAAPEAVAIGDRLETDIAGANRAGLHSVLVTTGVHGAQDVEQAQADGRAHQRPEHVVASLAELHLA